MTEGSPSPESQPRHEIPRASQETVGLQARLLMGEKGLAPDTHENTHIAKADLSADNIPYTHIDTVFAKATNDHWQNTEPALRKAAWTDAMQKRFTEYEVFWQGDKGRAWTETFKKIGFDPTNISTETTAINTLYAQIRSAPGESPTKRFADTIINAYTVDGSVQYDTLLADKEALTWIGRTIDATGLDIIQVITDARVTLQKNPDALVAAVNQTTQKEGKSLTRLSASTQKEAAILAKFETDSLGNEQSSVAPHAIHEVNTTSHDTVIPGETKPSGDGETAPPLVDTSVVASTDHLAALQHEAEKTPVKNVPEPPASISEPVQVHEVTHVESPKNAPEPEVFVYDIHLPTDAKDKKEVLQKQIKGLQECWTFFDAVKEAEATRLGIFDVFAKFKVVSHWVANHDIKNIGTQWNIKGPVGTIVTLGTPKAWDTIAADLQAMITRGEIDSYFPKQGFLDAWGIGKEDKDRPKKIKAWEGKIREARERNENPNMKDLGTIADMVAIKKQQLKKAA